MYEAKSSGSTSSSPSVSPTDVPANPGIKSSGLSINVSTLLMVEEPVLPCWLTTVSAVPTPPSKLMLTLVPEDTTNVLSPSFPAKATPRGKSVSSMDESIVKVSSKMEPKIPAVFVNVLNDSEAN